MVISEELLTKAKDCKSAAELISLAKESGMELSKEKAESFLKKNEEKIISDEELSNVAGGGCFSEESVPHELVIFPSREAVEFIYDLGDQILVFVGEVILCGTVKGRMPEMLESESRWVDEYYVQVKCSGYISGKFRRNTIVKE